MRLPLCPNITSLWFTASRIGYFALLFNLTTPAHAQTIADLDTTTSQMAAMLERFATDRAALGRSYNIPLSPLRADKMQQFYTAWQKALAQVDFNALQQDGRIDYLLFKNLLGYELRQLALEKERLAQISAYLPGWQRIVGL